jgi:phage N-6-adenine-methyltransferase
VRRTPPRTCPRVGNARHGAAGVDVSNQDVRTPREFLVAVEERFGPIVFDLAAHSGNAVARHYFGPGSEAGADALACDWPGSSHGLLWCNPPYRRIEPWAKKCAESRDAGSKIALLVPAAVCTGWFIDHVAPHAYVFELTPRVFKNEIRDCILAMYTPEGYHGREGWKWR